MCAPLTELPGNRSGSSAVNLSVKRNAFVIHRQRGLNFRHWECLSDKTSIGGGGQSEWENGQIISRTLISLGDGGLHPNVDRLNGGGIGATN